MVPQHIRGLLFLCLLSLATPVFCCAQTKQLRGRIFAYDPVAHAFKVASFAENQEIVILKTESKSRRNPYVKLTAHGFGQVQIPEEYFRGASVLTVNATRDSNCDRKPLEFVSDLGDASHATPQADGTVNVPLNSGKFLLSDSFRSQPAPTLSDLKCYSLKTTEQR